MRIEQTKVLDANLTKALVRWSIKNHKGVKISRIISFTFGVIALICGAYYMSVLAYSVGLINLAFGVFFVLWSTVLYPALIFRKNNELAKPTYGKTSTVILTYEQISIETEDERSEYSWLSVKSVTDIGEYICVTMNTRNLMLEKNKLNEEEIKWLFDYKSRG